MRALIAGVAAGGVGGATALRIARDSQARGEDVTMVVSATGRRPGLDEVVGELRSMGVDALAHPGDLREPTFPGELVDAALQHAGGLDVVIANAAVVRPAALDALTVERWDAAFDVNVRAVWLLAVAARDALARSQGSFIATGSTTQSAPLPWGGAYGISKAALLMLCRQMALEWASEGIRVNVVAPGPLRTPLTEGAYADPEFEATRRRQIPLGRIGAVDDVAGVISFLAGPDAAWITGESIAVDGGLAQVGHWGLTDSVRRLGSPRPTGSAG